MTARSELLDQLLEECAQGWPAPYWPQDRRAAGLPPRLDVPWPTVTPGEPMRLCPNGHEVTEWLDHPLHGCQSCWRQGHARSERKRRNRKSAA